MGVSRLAKTQPLIPVKQVRPEEWCVYGRIEVEPFDIWCSNRCVPTHGARKTTVRTEVKRQIRHPSCGKAEIQTGNILQYDGGLILEEDAISCVQEVHTGIGLVTGEKTD